jgi:DNA-directed RNA polymerase II subunit RPB1
MSSGNNSNANITTSNIIGVQFGILNPELIQRGSVCHVTIPDTYDNNVPKIGGLMDPRMGVIDISIKCHTCKQSSNDCIGHFGHIELALPVFHIQYMSIILKLLRCICFRCSNLLIDKSDIKLINKIKKISKKKRFDYIFNICNNSNQSNKIKHCKHNDGCFVIQPIKYTKLTVDKIKEKDGVIKISAEFPSEAFSDPNINKKQYFQPDMCLNIFRKIIPEDVELLGFSNEDSHPSWMICTVLVVPPPSVRPSISQDQIQRSEDDLTHKLAEIIKTNKMLLQKIEANAPEKTIEDHRTWVQYHVATLIDNEILGKNLQATRRSLRPLKVFKQRLSGKEGRLRHNLMGKRVDYSGRTVISVDPNIGINEFGVPLSICMNITFPEIVSPYNIDEMYRLIRNGPNIYPGAKSVEKIKCDEAGNIVGYRPYTLQYTGNNTQEQIELEYGDVVRRHLKDGDIALFNRQPSLHKMSMMAHEIKVLKKGSTFRLNVYVTMPYNADFDGDEMNCHVPQSIQTAYELQSIASVPTQIISPQGKPIINITQDTMIAAYLFTQGNYKISEYDMMNLVSVLSNFDGKVKQLPDGKYSGRDIYSKILPNMNLIKPNASYDNETSESDTYTDNLIIIKNGELMQGVLDKKLLGSTNGGIIHNIYNMYGKTTCSEYLNNHQRLITRWFSSHSFTIGIGDAVIKPNIQEKKDIILNTGIQDVDNLLKQAEEGVYNSNLSKSQIMESLEGDIKNILSKCMDDAGKLVNKSLDPKTNRLFQIVNSGSKGSSINITQIIACVGQQDMDGKRVPFNFSNRTLPHYHINDHSYESRGYVKNSFMEGLTPQEYFFHEMGGRNGVIDTAIKTADSGYTQRKLIKAMEDVKVNYDWTVRNASKKIIQFRYGDDSMDAAKLEVEKFKIIEMDNITLNNVYKYDNLDDKTYWNYILSNTIVNQLFATKGYEQLLDNEYNEIYQSRHDLRYVYYKDLAVINVSVLSPINFYRLIHDVIYKFNIQKHNKSDLNPLYIIEETNKILVELEKYNNITMVFFKILFKSHLASKRCITEYRFSKVAFDYMLELIKVKFFKSFITPGELVGPVAAQTIGEISTQLTLNTFHTAGTGMSIPSIGRLKEVIGVSSNIASPFTNIYLKEEYSENLEYAKTIVSQLEYTKLEDIITKTQILYELNTNSIIDEDLEFINTYHKFNDILGVDQCDSDNISPWILRFEFDKEIIINKGIYIYDIQTTILNNCINDNSEKIQCIFNDDNASNLVMRIKILHESNDDNYIKFLKELEKKILDITLKGIPNISKVQINKVNKIKYNDDGSYEGIKENLLRANGANLLEIISRDYNEYIDCTRILSNDICEILAVFGIEAVRNIIIAEMAAVCVMSLSSKHIGILADVMTYQGDILKISRHGVNKSDDNGPLHKCSFEETPDILSKAAIFSELDDLQGVSSNIIMGQFVKAGSNNFDILLDEEKLFNSKNSTLVENTNQYNLDEVNQTITEIYENVDTSIGVEESKETVETTTVDYDFDNEYNFNINRQYMLNPINMDGLKLIIV